MADKRKLSPSLRKLLAKRARAGDAKAEQKLQAHRRRPPELATLADRLLAETDGIRAHRLLDRIGSRVTTGEAEGKGILLRYCQEGRLDHVRKTASSRLADLVNPADMDLVAVIRELLPDPHVAWGLVRALLEIEGSDAWPTVSALARAETLDPRLIGEILLLLAKDSGQPLLSGCSRVSREWDRESIPTQALTAWEATGFMRGIGPPRLPRALALDAPTTPLENVAARLDQKLAGLGSELRDPHTPAPGLTPGSESDLLVVRKRWALPRVYMDFLTRFSPVGFRIRTGKLGQYLELFGAEGLVAAQRGFGVGSGGENLPGWPRTHVVIAVQAGGGIDPPEAFCLDLSRANDEDGPIVEGWVESGGWAFGDFEPSTIGFLRRLSRRRFRPPE